jgi:hypothetical protein
MNEHTSDVGKGRRQYDSQDDKEYGNASPGALLSKVLFGEMSR